MNYYILTLFPDMIQDAANTSITGRAVKNGLISVNTINIRDYSANKHMRVDDYPYGGGAGMVIEAEPVFRAVSAAKEKAGENTRVIYLTPQAKVLDQLKVEELSYEDNLIILCGHYEGIDERVLEEVVTDNISIGDYVLTGGELGALVLMDAVSRFVPGVLSNDESSRFESMKDDLLEYPHYTRPECWHNKTVPEVLLSGDHVKIEEWRHEKALERTKTRRPDLLAVSKNVHVIYMGGEAAENSAEELNRAVSLYGELLDYNRKKLRKSTRVFGRNDLVIFVYDKEGAELFPEAAERIRAHETPAVIVVPGSMKPEQTYGDLLRSCGFRLVDLISTEGEEPGKTALTIRKLVKSSI